MLAAYKEMMPLSPLHAAVFAALDSGALVLTANQRAARTLQNAWGQRMKTEGHALWQPPNIAVWENWASAQWQHLVLHGAETRVLLTPIQERLIWLQILTIDAASRTLRSPQSLAELAADAWRLLARFGGLRGGIGAIRSQFEAASTDTRAFLLWAQQFERRCTKDNLLSAAQLDDALRVHLEKRTLAVPTSQIVLVGFDRITPSQAAVCDALRAAGADVAPLEVKPHPSHIVVVETADPDAEMRTTARALRQRLAENPEVRLGVILPDIASTRTRLERIFLNELAPGLQLAGATGRRPFEFSLGITLDRIAMTRTAISLLRWTLTPLPLEEVSALLLSPYLAGAQAERYMRASWDAQQLRRANLLQPEIPLSWVLGRPQLPPILRAHLSAMYKLRADTVPSAPHRGATAKKAQLHSYGIWMEHAAALLHTVGWPGDDERALNSNEFQLQQRWQEMLDEISTLDFAGDRVDFATALAAIARAAAETLFAPQSYDAPVQIMGALESAGSAFDNVWFLNATDMQWPASTSTHPFIPWTVQRDLGMPGADIARTLSDGISITQRIAASASETTFSFARRGSEGEQRPSTCLQSLQIAEYLQAAPENPATPAIIHLKDAVDDDALPALPQAAIRGGAAILKLQAMCPFRAFAERRLYAVELDAVEAGLDPAERGSLIHDVMANFWERVRTRKALASLPDQERLRLLTTSIESALADQQAVTPWQRRYLQVQREWLLELLPAWLNEELDRPPFQVIHTEHSLGERAIGPLHVQLRVDRIDAMLQNEHELTDTEKDIASEQIILDYKTGNIAAKPWDGERPDEPQLPLYAVLADDRPIRGIAFALLKAGKMKLQQCAGTDFAPRVPEWRRVLTALAEGFAHGDTTVDPKHNDTCKYCALMGLCRIRERNAGGTDDA
jgi:probable DNA repair protein